jgi:hypothetical protein
VTPAQYSSLVNLVTYSTVSVVVGLGVVFVALGILIMHRTRR